MVDFIVRARAAPVQPDRFLAQVGTGLGIEYLADILLHGLFVSQGHRDDATVQLVLEKSNDFSRVVTINGDQLGSLDSLHQPALLDLIAEALQAGSTLDKEASVTAPRGQLVNAVSFEKHVKTLAGDREVFVLHPDGEDIRSAVLPKSPVFVMTDHTPMPRNTYKSMARQGVKTISVGPQMLHASQCIVLIHNELDRRNNPREKGF